MGVNKITLFVDVVSPFAYEAFHILQNDAIFRGVQKTYIPIFLGGLMKIAGNTPPMQIKNKDVWISKERLRWAQVFDIPMAAEHPPNFPPVTLHVMRAVCGVANDQAKLCAVLERLYHEFFVNHAAVAQPDVFAPIFKDVLGAAEAEKVLALAATEGKATLAKNTDDAFAAGAFGLPWMVCTNARGETEGFWGVDHLGHVTRFLDLPKPGNVGGWKAVL